jgi:predicted ATP-grasp superfamily ATP-dependent carboligase
VCHERACAVGGDLGDHLRRAVLASRRLDYSTDKVQVQLVTIHAKVEEMQAAGGTLPGIKPICSITAAGRSNETSCESIEGFIKQDQIEHSRRNATHRLISGKIM